MRMVHLVILSLALGASPLAFAKKKVSAKPRRPSQTAPIHFRVVYGEKTSVFLINSTRVDFSNNQGLQRSANLSVSDYNLLRGKIQKLPTSTNIEKCPRSYIEVTAEAKRIADCIGASTPIAKELQSTANLLGLLF